jgi:hypothetical protein
MLFNPNLLTLQSEEFIRGPLPTKKEAESFQDDFEVTYTTPERSYLSDVELAAIAPGSIFTFDSESYVNYWVVAFKHIDSGKYITFEDKADKATFGLSYDIAKLRWMIQTFLCVGFNSKSYDVPMVTLALQGFNPKQLKQASNAIIFGQLLPYQIEQHYKVNLIACNHIDLIEVAPLKGSLKLYAGRLHSKRMQDLLIDEVAVLTPSQVEEIREHCLYDLDNTEDLLKDLMPQIELRYTLSNQYRVDLRSKSDAQIAEAVIAAELHRLTGLKPERPKNYSKYFFYQVPSFVKFNNPILQNALQLIRDTPFEVGENGEVQMPPAISDLSIKFGQCVYRLGMGGLHSSEKTIAHKATADTLLIDRDVASYYPQIIINQQLHPKHLGKGYLEVYKSIVRRRIDAKHSGDKTTAASLKITVNGLFGKYGNKWSIVYSPDVLIQITVSGQLCLLKLIEMIEEAGIPVISANTDGVVVACPAALEPALEAAVKAWEYLTSFETEETRYSAIYSRDVNNYIAVKENGEIKVKGSYSERGSSGDTILSKNPETLICNDAATAFVGKGIAIETTICECKDIRRFVVVRNVKGGAVKSGKYLGKTIRWYYSTKMKGDIRYVTSGNKVPNSDGAMPLMELPEGNILPEDLDYSRYIEITQTILAEIAAIPPSQKLQGSLFG